MRTVSDLLVGEKLHVHSGPVHLAGLFHGVDESGNVRVYTGMAVFHIPLTGGEYSITDIDGVEVGEDPPPPVAA